MEINKLSKNGKQIDTKSASSGLIRAALKDDNLIPTSGMTLQQISKYLYNDQEIKDFNINEAIDKHPLSRRPTNIRSKLAYREIMTNLKPTSKYLLPGQIVCFEYLEPKYAEDLEYYDKTPLTIFFGITKTKDGNIREVGLNLHYFPPFSRKAILRATYNVFKTHFDKNFNKIDGKPATFISYKALKALLNRHNKIKFGVKMYIPVLRSRSFVIPTRMLPTAFYTEGHFSKATLAQIRTFWRKATR